MLLFTDGFDHYAIGDILTKWTGQGLAGAIVTGRNGNGWAPNSATTTRWLSKSLPANYSTLIVGFSWKNITSAAAGNFAGLAFVDSVTGQLKLCIDELSGDISIRRGSTVLTTVTSAVSTSIFNYFEIKVTFHSTAGTIDVRVNGVSIISLTNQNTIVSANAYANAIYLNGTSTATLPLSTGSQGIYDDFYICDTSGSMNNNFLGDIKIVTIYADAEGSAINFTPSTGTTHYTLINETAPNIATFNSDSVIGNVDMYNYSNISTVGNILGVQINSYCNKDDANTRIFVNNCKSGNISANSSTKTLSTASQYYTSVQEVDPLTSAAWTLSGLNSAEFGVKIVG